jgi:hypothetical protein
MQINRSLPVIAEEVLHELLGRGFRSEVLFSAGILLRRLPLLALLCVRGGAIGDRLWLGVGLTRLGLTGLGLTGLGLTRLGVGLHGRRVNRLLVGDGRLRSATLIAQELAEAHDRALLQRVLVQLAVLDEPSGDAAGAP